MLSRSFGRRKAVDGITLTINSGEILALFGPNGAGKTTLLRLLAGLLKPTAGTAQIGGVSLPGGPSVRRRIGIVSHHTLLYEAFTARENVEFAARLYRVKNFRQESARALERMHILDRADTPVRALSRGLRQRVSVARATVHQPEVILADEPFTGLDILGATALSGLLESLRVSGATIVVVTHNLEEGLSLSTHAAIMDKGRIAELSQTSMIDRQIFADRYRQIVTTSG